MLTRTYEREFGNSPFYKFINDGSVQGSITQATSVTSTVPLVVDLETGYPSSMKYGAMNTVQIQNGSSSDLIFYPNQDRNQGYPVSAGTTITFKPQDIPAFRTALVFTSSGTATTSQIRVTCWKSGITQDDIARMQFESMYKKGGMLW